VAWRGNEYGFATPVVANGRIPKSTPRQPAIYAIFYRCTRLVTGHGSLQLRAGQRAKGIERTGYADFWELYKRNVLPRETKNYVPIIVALTLIAKDAAHYGIQADPGATGRTDVVKPRARD